MKKIFSEITKYIQQNKNVLIVAHKGMDLDAIGASLCLYRIIESQKKNPYIFLEDIAGNETIKKSIETINNLNINFVTASTVNKLSNDNTIVIVVDTNKKGLLAYSNLLENYNKIIVIDHHIKTGDSINALFTYIDNKKSSATEIILEYLQETDAYLEAPMATIMLAGIEIDTNGFNIKTTSDTFRAAAKLLDLGANNIEKQKLLKVNKENYCKRQDFIKSSYMINNNMALCIMDNNIYQRYELALISEDLLQFNDVEASFTIGFIDKNTVGISARSIGKINVEKIMRKLNGGGHQTDAACSVNSKEIEPIKKELLKCIGVIK